MIAAVVLAIEGDQPAPREPAEAARTTIGVDQQRSDPFNVVFDLQTIRTYNILLDDDEQAQLTRDPTAEVYVRGAVEIDGDRIDPIGVRYKGFFGVLRACFVDGRQVCPKLSWKLKFNEYDPASRFHGLKRLNFHAMNGDEAQMREVISYQVFRNAGVIAPRSVFANLQLNGEPIGLYTLTEDIDDRFIADRFRDRGRGVLYKEIWPGRIDSLWAFQVTLTDAIARGPRNPAGLIEFSEAVSAADGNEAVYAALLDNLQQPDDLFNYLAADRLTDNWDGIVAWYCVPECLNHNYFWYQDALSGRFTLIPWDLEHSWRSPSPIREYYDMPDWDDLHRSCRMRKVFWDLDARAPHCDPVLHAWATLGWERYIDASRALLRDTLSLDLMHERVDQIAALIGEHVRADTRGPGQRDWQAAVVLLHQEIDDRWQYIEAKIDAWDESQAQLRSAEAESQ